VTGLECHLTKFYTESASTDVITGSRTLSSGGVKLKLAISAPRDRAERTLDRNSFAVVPQLRVGQAQSMVQEETMSISLIVNGMVHNVDLEPETPLLWVLRDSLKLTGTKYGCGIAQCGACTVLIDGRAARSCSVTLSAATGKSITTIEGLNGSHPVQLAWIEFDVPQCGYCQSGQIMAAVGLLQRIRKPTDADIDAGMDNICRCGTYLRIRQAVHRAAELQA
jgi:isoquinoline 1-oxidoreductase subunit alpha